MDDRLIFLYHQASVISEGGTQGGRHRRVLDVPVQACRRGLQVNPQPRYLREASARPQGLIKRSEEHTSELQSLAYLVCRLLLEKKKKKQRDPRSISDAPSRMWFPT